MIDTERDRSPAESPPSPPEPPARRRWLRFGLRTMLGVVLLMALALGWWFNGVRRQRQAIATIRALYPHAHISFESRGLWTKRAEDTRPAWLKTTSAWIGDRVPDHYLYSVKFVLIGEGFPPQRPSAFTPVMDAVKMLDRLEALVIDSGVQDSDVLGLDRLSHLEVLAMSGPSPNLTDAGLATLLEIPNLKELKLGDCAATDAWMTQLKALPHLREFCLGDEETLATESSRLRVTGMGLADLPGLTELTFCSPALTHEGIAQLRSLRQLQQLKLGGPVFPSDLANLRVMTQLEHLRLINTEVRGQGLDVLAKLPNLGILEFHHELINDSHLSNFLEIPTLWYLGFWDTDVTWDKASAFRTAHPRLSAGTSPLQVSVASLGADNPIRTRSGTQPPRPVAAHSGVKP